MALSTVSQPEAQTGQATTEAPGPGRSSVRERFAALTKRQQDEILDKHRDYNIEPRYYNIERLDWWDGVYAVFKHDMEIAGIEVDEMYFSGFWSQGDGACFDGHVSNWHDFLTSLGHTCPALIALAANAWLFKVAHRGHYYHENCTSFSHDMVTPKDYYEGGLEDFVATYSPYSTDIQNAAFVAILQEYDYDKLYDEFEEAFKNHMRDLYSRLNETYDDLTSDESVLASLEANDMLTEIIDELKEEYA